MFYEEAARNTHDSLAAIIFYVQFKRYMLPQPAKRYKWYKIQYVMYTVVDTTITEYKVNDKFDQQTVRRKQRCYSKSVKYVVNYTCKQRAHEIQNASNTNSTTKKLSQFIWNLWWNATEVWNV